MKRREGYHVYRIKLCRNKILWFFHYFERERERERERSGAGCRLGVGGGSKQNHKKREGVTCIGINCVEINIEEISREINDSLIWSYNITMVLPLLFWVRESGWWKGRERDWENLPFSCLSICINKYVKCLFRTREEGLATRFILPHSQFL